MWITILIVIGYIIFGLVLVSGLVGALLGLPGTTIILIDALIYSAITGWDRLPWWMLVILAVLVLLAESSDSLIAALGARAAGGSNKTSIAAVVGILLGAIIGGLVLSPLLGLLGISGGPVGLLVGFVLPPLAGGMAGGFAAAYWYEKHTGKDHTEALQAGWGVLLGRMGAALVKGLVACVMIATIIYSILATAPTPG